MTSEQEPNEYSRKISDEAEQEYKKKAQEADEIAEEHFANNSGLGNPLATGDSGRRLTEAREKETIAKNKFNEIIDMGHEEALAVEDYNRLKQEFIQTKNKLNEMTEGMANKNMLPNGSSQPSGQTEEVKELYETVESLRIKLNKKREELVNKGVEVE
jgi:hypothetical protein